jgi:hypothetical protein
MDITRSIKGSKKSIKLKTVLLQGHFYSLHLLFASANKTTFQSRMIDSTPILITGKSVQLRLVPR